ncbi:hypothetical protein SUDANB95_03292 [Actinosynnema sp. ALI-1.44]
MVVFACARCGAPLTAPVSRVALPAHAHQHYGHELLPSLVEPGTYAVEPAHSGGPWRRWEEFSAEEVEARGVYAPSLSLPCGAPGAIAVAPGDTRGTVVIPERCDGYCMGLAGNDGPNLACAVCGREVGTRIDDCGYWQAVWLVPDAVRPVQVNAPRPVAGWEEWARDRAGIPPVDPNGHWDPRWEAAVGAALAHLLVAAEGRPVAVPGGLLTATFGPALAALLPKGPPEREVRLAGPGLPAAREPDIALVPRHPQTGEAWQPAGSTATQSARSTATQSPSAAARSPSAAARSPRSAAAAQPAGGAAPQSAGGVAVVPLEAGVWAHLAFHRSRPLPPATGGVPDDVIRDDPLPPHTGGFRVDSRVFQDTLARLPAVREPWLRRIYDRVREHPYRHPF